MGLVQIVFSDATLGGTSRSAAQIGAAWSKRGYDVSFLPQMAPHPAREADLRRIGDVSDPVQGIVGGSRTIVHYHHGAWSNHQRSVAKRLIAQARDFVKPPRLITHNVFGIPDSLLDHWPSERVVGVLGSWSAAQYRLASARRSALAIVPNAQNSETFRPPAPHERLKARESLSLPASRRIALRLGSPHDGKWSTAYVDLVKKAPDVLFVLVGVPSQLAGMLEHEPNVVVRDVVQNDAEILDLYWAADVFVHMAKRGESFGNVLMEAILTGLPVVYLARPYRDNTPWEFRRFEGFHYVTRAQDLVTVLSTTQRMSPAQLARNLEIAQARYSVEAVGAQLEALTRGERAPGFEIASLSSLDLAKVAVRHNSVNSALKSLRLRVRG